ncbi:hypothetical protein [Pseudoduganella namucuonensis]|uniref:Uncharacterized protein n=1 Tax=Pseudoduganella namucuonensis TaxID=1035707 RepID=A0A1I7LYI0_9BURK|nr:hypothetical protein [Pseudoduganella namucuonensis]SFV14728.1 hypothetical protein SAMN05216552_104341 [Pseudoduganella namucuonensis]
MRSAFEAWAQRDGHIVRRREDKPEEYLVFETQRRWVIWQAALEHGKSPAGRKSAAQKDAAVVEKAASARAGLQRAPAVTQEDAQVRNQVLNEVLDAFSRLDGESGMDDILKVIQSLKKGQVPQQAAAVRTIENAKATER